MNLLKLYEMQKKLDERIRHDHHLENKNLFQEKIVALIVEVSELANETRCFKYWSEKPSSPPEIILEEYVDGLHFIFSIGIELNFIVDKLNENTVDKEEADLVSQFLKVFRHIQLFANSKDRNDYEQLLVQFFKLGYILGFTNEEIRLAYLAKNEINHQRQDQGY